MAAHDSKSSSGFSGVRVVGGGVGLTLVVKSLEPDDLVWRREYPPVDILRDTVFRRSLVGGPVRWS